MWRCKSGSCPPSCRRSDSNESKTLQSPHSPWRHWSSIRRSEAAEATPTPAAQHTAQLPCKLRSSRAPFRRSWPLPVAWPWLYGTSDPEQTRFGWAACSAIEAGPRARGRCLWSSGWRWWRRPTRRTWMEDAVCPSRRDCSCGWGVIKSDQRGVIDRCAENSMFSRRLSLLGYRRRGGRAGPNSVFTRIGKKKKVGAKNKGKKGSRPIRATYMKRP